MLSALHYSNGERSLQDLIHEIARGEKQVWLHTEGDKFNATVVTQVTQFPGKKTCEILYLGGDKAIKYLDDIREIEVWAKAEGCHDIQVIGRDGWAKVLKQYGYDKRYVVTGKVL